MVGHTGIVKQAFLSKSMQSRLKPVHAIVRAWEVLVPICHVPQLWKMDIRNVKDHHIQQSSNMKLFDAQNRKETAKGLQFLELMEATFDCGRNTRQRSASVSHLERNSLDRRKEDFLKLMMMQSSCFLFQQT
jgi:hypothetical protein